MNCPRGMEDVIRGDTGAARSALAQASQPSQPGAMARQETGAKAFWPNVEVEGSIMYLRRRGGDGRERSRWPPLVWARGR